MNVQPVADLRAHVLHAYFNMPPESPDGRWVLAFVSTRPDAHVGDVCLLPRGGGELRVLAAGVEVEDAHRQACQQFVAGGAAVAFQHLRDGAWRVEVADVDTGRRRVLAEQRQLGFCRADLPFVATMALHWDRSARGDVTLIDVADGAQRPGVPLEAVRPHAARLLPDSGYADAVALLAFPIISPSGRRIACKIARPGDGVDFRSPHASVREGLFVYDLDKQTVCASSDHWGHPDWHPDGRRIVTPRSSRLHWFNSDTGDLAPLPDLPTFPGSHPSVRRDGRCIATDALRGEKPDRVWTVELVDLDTNAVTHVHTQSAAAPATTSWRPAHPHPVWNRVGDRLYFNVNEGQWTRLHVAPMS